MHMQMIKYSVIVVRCINRSNFHRRESLNLLREDEGRGQYYILRSIQINFDW